MSPERFRGPAPSVSFQLPLPSWRMGTTRRGTLHTMSLDTTRIVHTEHPMRTNNHLKICLSPLSDRSFVEREGWRVVHGGAGCRRSRRTDDFSPSSQQVGLLAASPASYGALQRWLAIKTFLASRTEIGDEKWRDGTRSLLAPNILSCSTAYFGGCRVAHPPKAWERTSSHLPTFERCELRFFLSPSTRYLAAGLLRP